ncbi:MAG: DUF4169 family protein [Hyphomicrobiales bacterium]|nr:DUF4169 family protein [Hyphomicrobiales bacterium]MCC7482807.1 DUF4169 family protein [Hyphomicrobiales bacterium]
MAEVVNLRGFRKRKERAEKETVAQVNRAAFGRTKSEKEMSKAQRALEKKALDTHRRED